jgi:K+-transporting ATPase KdpF subunit
MSFDLWLTSIISFGLGAYLVYAIIYPEKF